MMNMLQKINTRVYKHALKLDPKWQIYFHTIVLMFIIELVNVLHNTEERGIHYLNEQREITTLLFADDHVLVSDTVRDLQSKLNILKGFSYKWNLNINIE